MDGHPDAGKKLIIVLLLVLARQCFSGTQERDVHIENLNIRVDAGQQQVRDADVEAERRNFEKLCPP